ncbi:TonB-dependent receptor domain-containing protein [Helicobacter sp. T3_23-1059]
MQESSTDFATSQSASQSSSQSNSFVDSTSIDSASIDSLQNPQSNSLDLAESKHNNSTKSKKSKRYNKLTKNTDKYDSKYDNMEAKQLDKVVVTASGYEQDIKNAPATISIIPKEEIMSRPIRDLGDAVQDVPGVSVEMQKTGGNSISMRGLGSNYTLILIDGKRQNVAQGFSTNGFGEALNANMPPPSMIERIEVIRGPASTIYGSDAMGGVINIITKKHTDKVTAGVQFDMRFSENPDVFGNIYGANGYVTTPLVKKILSLNLRGGFKVGEQNNFLKPAGLTTTNGTSAYTNPYATHSATGFTNWNAGFRFNYTPESHNSLYFDAEAYFARVGSLNTSGNQITGIRDFYKVNSVLNHDADYDWGKLNTYLQYSATLWASHYGYNATTGQPDTNAGVAIGASRGAGVNWDAASINQDAVFQTTYNKAFDLDWAGAIIFNGGLYYLYENLWRKSNGVKMDMHQVALFGEGEYLINEYVSTTLGLRLNYSDKFKSIAVPNPRFYVNVFPTKWLTFKAGISSGVLVPQLSYLYDGWQFTTSRGTQTGVLGNKDLKPEQSWNYELSAIFDFESTNLTLTGYYTDFRDKVSTQPYTDGTCANIESCSRVLNVDKSLVTGAELAFKLKPIYYGIGLDMSYAFTYTEILSSSARSGNTSYADYYKGEPLNLIPRHSFVIKPSYKIGGFEAFLRWSGKFQTPTPIPAPNNQTAGNNLVRGAIGKFYKDYQILDLSLSYKFDFGLAATFAINNLLDTNFWDPIIFNNNQNYTNQYQRILPSRNYWLTLRYDF